MGRGNVVEHDTSTGMNLGASDPRGDGAAIPEMPKVPTSTVKVPSAVGPGR
jgi:hypothetical protein